MEVVVGVFRERGWGEGIRLFAGRLGSEGSRIYWLVFGSEVEGGDIVEIEILGGFRVESKGRAGRVSVFLIWGGGVRGSGIFRWRCLVGSCV